MEKRSAKCGGLGNESITRRHKPKSRSANSRAGGLYVDPRSRGPAELTMLKVSNKD